MIIDSFESDFEHAINSGVGNIDIPNDVTNQEAINYVHQKNLTFTGLDFYMDGSRNISFK